MPAYWSAIVTASSHGGALGGTYTATLGAFSSGTESMLFASISPRIKATLQSSSASPLGTRSLRALVHAVLFWHDRAPGMAEDQVLKMLDPLGGALVAL